MYYKGKRCVGEEVVVMVILSCALCFSLGACIGFVAAGMFANASNRVQRDVVFRKVAFRFGGRPRHDTTVVDGERRYRSASRVERIKATCDLGRMHARSMRDRSLAPELAASESKSYELYKRDAIALARRVTDRVSRDHAVGHLIDLWIHGGEEEEAGALFELVQSDLVRRQIAARHPVSGMISRFR